MGWMRGELWLDTDVWVRGGSAAVATYAPAPLPSLAPPPGLVASRLRRAAWKHRRNARRARATAIALSPAVMFVLVGLRSAGDPGTRISVEDAPRLTFRPATPKVGDAPHPVGVRRNAAKLERVHGTVVRSEPAPKIEWHRASSLGVPFGGSLIDGTQLPIEGPNWVTWSPVTDSVPNAPRRLYGNEHTIRAIVSVAAAYRAANPEAPPLLIGDISREGGGPMTDEHVSHQNGLDVDIYYPRLDRAMRAPTATDEIDFRLSQDLLDRFVAAGAQMVFVGFSTGLRGPGGVVIPYPSHEYHMHVRFPPAG